MIFKHFRNIFSIKPGVNKREKLCNAPFTNLFFSVTGEVFVCCFNQRQVIGNIKSDTVKEIWNGEKLKNFRNIISGNNFPEGCDECANYLKNKTGVRGLLYNYDRHPPDKSYPVSLEFQISNICNLECTMCSGDFSSVIALKRENRNQPENPYKENFLHQINEVIPFLKYTMFSGGEPFAIPAYFKIWEQITENNPACEITVQTNGTILNEKIRAILEKGRFSIGVSIDSFNETNYRAIRQNAELAETLCNIDYFKTYCKSHNTTISISFCPMQQNRNEIPALLNYCNQNDIEIYFSHVYFPGKNALWVLSSGEINNIITELGKHRFIPHNRIQKLNFDTFRNLLARLEAWSKSSEKWEKFEPAVAGTDQIKLLVSEIIDRVNSQFQRWANNSPIQNRPEPVTSRILDTLEKLPDNELKMKSLLLIKEFSTEKIISDIFREDDNGLYLLIKNIHRYKEIL